MILGAIWIKHNMKNKRKWRDDQDSDCWPLLCISAITLVVGLGLIHAVACWKEDTKAQLSIIFMRVQFGPEAGSNRASSRSCLSCLSCLGHVYFTRTSHTPHDHFLGYITRCKGHLLGSHSSLPPNFLPSHFPYYFSSISILVKMFLA